MSKSKLYCKTASIRIGSVIYFIQQSL